jgi:hypothetical protein
MQRANAIAEGWLVDAATFGGLPDWVTRGLLPQAAASKANPAVAMIATAL